VDEVTLTIMCYIVSYVSIIVVLDFTAQCYASTVYAMALCLSVSHKSQSLNTLCLQKPSHLWLAIIFTYTVQLQQFLACQESRQSKPTLFSHLT